MFSFIKVTHVTYENISLLTYLLTYPFDKLHNILVLMKNNEQQYKDIKIVLNQFCPKLKLIKQFF